jgi:FtsP/CotA-like multicopper oxidase with cupredoxin domain
VIPAARIRISTIVVLGAALAYGAGFWLVLVHHAEGGHEAGEPALLLHALRDGTLALPGVLAAVWLGGTLALGLVDRHGRLPTRWRAGLLAAGAALAGAIVLAAGSPLHALFFGAEEGHGLPLALHLGRDTLLALAGALPLAGVVVAAPGRAAMPVPRRRPAPEPALAATATPARSATLTRRTLVAGGLAGAAAAGVGLTRMPKPARAQVVTDHLPLFINDGHVPMVDGTLVYMRGYGGSPAGDPAPSLTIDPQLFLRERVGPLASRIYPVVGEDRIPEEGVPADAGIDRSGVGRHFIRRRFWASFFPQRTIVAESGSRIRLRITNRLAEPHTFTIAGVVDATIAPGATRDVEFDAPGPGTYVYSDTENAPVNRVLGLFGVLLVVPADAPWTFDGREAEFERQFLWIFHDIDTEWARRARMGATIDPVATPAVPRYFTINDRSGVFSLGISPDEASNRRAHEDTRPGGHGRAVDVRDFSDPAFGTGQLIRIVNTGIAVHQPHWHGNHVWTVAVNNEVLSRSTPRISPDGHILLQHWEDVVELDPMQSKAVILPVKPPPDALEAVIENQACEFIYPMHCHAEMSQTAGGGLYPGGQVTDWILRP